MTSPVEQRRVGLGGRTTALVCAGLLVIFSICSLSAVLTKNATVDEPTHVMSGWLELRRGDFRIGMLNPSLWKIWASLANVFSTPAMTCNSPVWNDLSWDPRDEVVWTSRTLYNTPGNDGDGFVNRARCMMLLAGIGLGVLIAAWSYKLAGPVAAVVATFLFCFDPNFIAHSPLMKSDVALALVMTGLVWLIWTFGRHGSLWKAVSIGLLCGVGLNVKFSAVLFGPMLTVMLAARAVSKHPWAFGRQIIVGRPKRFCIAVGTGVIAAVICFVVTWACYGFRFLPSRSPVVRINMQAIFDYSARAETTVAIGHHPSGEDIARHAPSLPLRFVEWANDHRALPQAFLGGFLYQRDCTLAWPAFLNGELYGDGRWYYFPLAMLYKTPLATLAALLAATLVGGFVVWKSYAAGRARSSQLSNEKPGIGWTVFCFLIPFCIFAFAAMQSQLNIGVRSVLPLYPFMYIGIGCAAACTARSRPRLTGFISAVLALGLASETLSAWPDYIAFFNVAAGGKTGGIAHLGDSNLDWGQDLKPLADWQRTHPAVPMFVDYNGVVDAHFYGLKFDSLWIDSTGKPTSNAPLTPGVLVVESNHLQGLYITASATPFYAWLRMQQPVDIVGGTLYIYRFTPGSFENAIQGSGHP